MDDVVLVAGARTAIGKFNGGFVQTPAFELGAAAIKAALERARVEPAEVDEVVMGQVGQVGPDAYNARRCALAAGLPMDVTAQTVNRLCSSGLQAIWTGANTILTGNADIVVSGGDENMSMQPFLAYGERGNARLGDRSLRDGTMMLLEDPFGRYQMGETAEIVAERFGVTRADQDAFALDSQTRAQRAMEAGFFDEEIVEVAGVTRDEHPRANTTLEALTNLKPAFRKDGSVTAGNAAGINDGAGAVVLMRESEAKRRGHKDYLVFRGAAVAAVPPEIMGVGPVPAVKKLMDKLAFSLADVDIIELNEAFAAQALAVMRDSGMDASKVNPNGGAIALGHPIGATGAILTVKLMYALRRTGKRFGLVTMCIGGGQGMAALFERTG
jgi:acetyl-CoA C-acetyltransferase